MQNQPFKKDVNLEPERYGFEAHFYYLLVVRLLENHVIYLRLGFIICRMGDTTYSTDFEELGGVIDIRS